MDAERLLAEEDEGWRELHEVLGSIPPERFEEYVRERLQGAEYVIVGDEFYEQYRHREADYPAVVRFYRELFAGQRGFREVRTFQTRPSLFGLTWDDDRSELTYRLFDHPKVRVFRRIANGPQTGAPPS